MCSCTVCVRTASLLSHLSDCLRRASSSDFTCIIVNAAGSARCVVGATSKEVTAMYNKLPGKYAVLCNMFGTYDFNYPITPPAADSSSLASSELSLAAFCHGFKGICTLCTSFKMMRSIHMILLALCAGKLQTVHAVQSTRQQRCTLQNSQHALENHCGRRFLV